MWTAEHRRAANRRGLRYPSDLTDADWAMFSLLERLAGRVTNQLGDVRIAQRQRLQWRIEMNVRGMYESK